MLVEPKVTLTKAARKKVLKDEKKMAKAKRRKTDNDSQDSEQDEEEDCEENVNESNPFEHFNYDEEGEVILPRKDEW